MHFWNYCSVISRKVVISKFLILMFKYSKSIPYLSIMHKNVRVGRKGSTNMHVFCHGKKKGIKWMLVSTNMHFLSWEKERRKVNIWEWQIWEGGWFIIHCVTIKPLSCLCHSHYQPAELFVIGKLGKFDQMFWLEVGDNKYRRGGGL